LIAREKRGGDCEEEEMTIETQKNSRNNPHFVFGRFGENDSN
jgi:hypothetical protein